MLQIAAGSPLLPAHITSANLTLLLLTEKRVFKLCSKGRLLCLTNSLRYPPHNSHNASSCHRIWNAKDRITFNYKHILFSIIRRNIFTPKIIIYWDCRDVRCDTCISAYVFDADVPDFKMLVFKWYSVSVQLPSYKWRNTLLMPSNFLAFPLYDYTLSRLQWLHTVGVM